MFPDHRVLLPADAGISFFFEENGSSFHENALGKAGELFRLAQQAVIADDSGLVIPALGGEPGIYSARYGGEQLTSVQRNEYLLERMEGVSDRRAFFVCALVLLLDEYRYTAVQETVPGVIIDASRGDGGFGYDPVFFTEAYGMTMAELTAEQKHHISHRGKAARTLQVLLQNFDQRGA